MNCDKYDDLIHQSLDGELNSSEQKVLDAHLETCEDCTMKYEELKLLKEVLTEESLLELPDGFSEDLHRKLMNEDKPKKTSIFKRRAVQNGMVGLVAAALALVIVVPSALNNMPGVFDKSMEDSMEYGARGSDANFTVTTAGAPDVAPMEAEGNFALTFDESVEEEAMMDAAPVMAEPQEVKMSTSSINQEMNQVTSETDHLDVNERKVIKNGELNLDITDYDLVYQTIVNMTQDIGGYVQNSNEQLKSYNRYSDEDPLKYGVVSVRVPSEMFSVFIEQMKEFGIVTNSHTYATDVSYQYRNAVSEVQNLEVTERSLRDLMEKAEDIDDIIYIERELMRVRSDINMYMGSIKQWDDLASMSSLQIALNEVEVLEGEVKPLDDSLWTKAQKALINNLNGLTRIGEGLVIWFVATLPMLLIFGISVFVFYKLLKWIIKRLFN